jgi:malate synthase
MSMSPSRQASPTLEILGPVARGYDEILSPEALDFVADLVGAFAPGIHKLLASRTERQARFDAGERPGFLAETATVREAEWTVAPLPRDLHDRRVEITGPVDRKMIINGMNSGASVFMADFEDSCAPTWANVVEGQIHLRDAVRGTIRFRQPETDKIYKLLPQTATLMVRPRGLHLVERHLRFDGWPAPAALVDFGLFFFHNANELVARGTGPYFYLPKMQSHLEARLWNDVFVRAQEALGIPRGTIKATVLIETLPAAFEMDEILFELREHSAGLNCGRWDYIFSSIKTLRNDPGWVIPDRAQVTMEQPFLRAYTQLLVKTCHRRRAHAMGGMAAFIPIKDDAAANEAALEKVRADKRREVKDGHDGTWVAHPGLVPVAREVFDAHMPGPNQLHVTRDDVKVAAEDLVRVPTGTRTEEGLRHNIRVGVQYLEAWLRGSGCVPLYNLMEDAATAEISRTQVWQWIHHGAALEDGRAVTRDLFSRLLDDEVCKLLKDVGEARFVAGRFREARDLFHTLSTKKTFEEFLTLPAYEVLLALTGTVR